MAGDHTFTLAPLRGSFLLTVQAAHGLVLESVMVADRT